jgi:hypothetical protein
VNDQRRSKRYDLHLPLKLRASSRLAREEACETRNLSSGGVLFSTHQPMEPGDLIEYEIALPPKDSNGTPVTLHCRGKVLRSRPLDDPKELEVAATLERYEFLRPD